MTSSSIKEFVAQVVYDHSIATGLKACESDQQIVNYAFKLGFDITYQDWLAYVESDNASLTTAEIERIDNVSPQHWSWAFRRVQSWRSMLMDGA